MNVKYPHSHVCIRMYVPDGDWSSGYDDQVTHRVKAQSGGLL